MGIIVFVCIVCIGIAILVLFRASKPTLSKKETEYFLDELKKIQKNPSFSAQIIDMDTLLHQILKKMWYVGNFGEILKQNPSVIPDINTIWKYHKLRNSLVHTLEKRDESTLEKSAHEYAKEIKKILL